MLAKVMVLEVLGVVEVAWAGKAVGEAAKVTLG
jgi:hypothetical protein